MTELVPAPFVVGAPRSGTTLLRLMLDAHPLVAIPPETGFLPLAAALPADATRAQFEAFVTGFESWPDFHLTPDAWSAALAACAPFDVRAGVRAFYRLYAERFSKPRWGDKTPSYALHLPALAALLPEARFIHVIRDGRDVALSLRPLWFAPSRAMDVLAGSWAQHVGAARAFGRTSASYMELRYEDLVRTPRPVLERVCAFLELPWDDALLRHHERAAERLAEHAGRQAPDGTARLTPEQRLRQQASALQPPDPRRAGRWRGQLTEAEAADFGRGAGGLLRELGYDA